MTDSSPDPLASLCSPSRKRVRSPSAVTSPRKPLVRLPVSPAVTPRFKLQYLEVEPEDMDDISAVMETLSPPPSRMAMDEINEDSGPIRPESMFLHPVIPDTLGKSANEKALTKQIEPIDHRLVRAMYQVQKAQYEIREMRKPARKRRKPLDHAMYKQDQIDNIKRARHPAKSQASNAKARAPVRSRQSSITSRNSIHIESPGKLRPSLPNIESSDLAFPPPEMITVTSSAAAADYAAQVLTQQQYDRVHQWNTYHWRVLESLLEEVGPVAAIEKFIETEGFGQREIEKRIKVLEIKRGLKDSDKKDCGSRAQSVETDTMSVADNAKSTDGKSVTTIATIEDFVIPPTAEKISQSPGIWNRLFGSKSKSEQKKRGWLW
ncbi:hypothetical protein NEOLI_003959 [Neolecta irregularis DAH-3]|uniref:Uncharacterized protein n=1 Tax=Neolecta irregularis (strain DAH-3) TaxID=1198029 RepID=A0A1U7LPA2_NEOID|nr:hypothetical protein NEOLI_003959 [Neolecta irregularis DAH-3]|eukprot:OLL24500.1 hypothetical protein NEOLI_003959 [Neolecta irregularis DAH-3]